MSKIQEAITKVREIRQMCKRAESHSNILAELTEVKNMLCDLQSPAEVMLTREQANIALVCITGMKHELPSIITREQAQDVCNSIVSQMAESQPKYICLTGHDSEGKKLTDEQIRSLHEHVNGSARIGTVCKCGKQVPFCTCNEAGKCGTLRTVQMGDDDDYAGYHACVYESDGGPCGVCGKTLVERNGTGKAGEKGGV
jgi:hypothetical protein